MKSQKNRYTIRSATICDCEDILRLYEKSILAVNYDSYSKGQLALWAGGMNADSLKKNLTKEIKNTFLAIENNKIIGFCRYYENNIEAVYVVPDYSGLGVGSLLLEFAEGKIEGVEINVISSLNAQKFYEKQGYFSYIEIDYDLENGAILPALLMKKARLDRIPENILSHKVEKRSVKICGHSTSISIEPPFWEILEDIAKNYGVSVNRLVAAIDDKRSVNLSSAIRLYVLDYILGSP